MQYSLYCRLLSNHVKFLLIADEYQFLLDSLLLTRLIALVMDPVPGDGPQRPCQLSVK